MLMLADHRVPTADESGSVERRRGLRIRQARPVKVYEPCVTRYFGGQTEDVSTTGLRLELPLSTPIRAGRTVNVHVGPNDGGQLLANRRQMIPARVVWIGLASQRQRGRMVAGLEFVATAAAQVDAA